MNVEHLRLLSSANELDKHREDEMETGLLGGSSKQPSRATEQMQDFHGHVEAADS